ncbi:Fumble [Strongyloides ratti]|uniref:pantothenate kinase n=1 Tax=Strongyloides ratti TaxID=34506 RepID=A0A090MWQ4_STRRB|nr:Fumble [Strongyloides ratti]CEF64089.1 Fumble [Strongyloides ratti]
MLWFGMDIGGTLVKLVYFEPDVFNHSDISDIDREKTNLIHKYLVSNKAYGDTGVRDEHLELKNIVIYGKVGTIHFIRFPTDRMENFIKIVKSKGFSDLASIVCATGGGAIKYAKITEEELNMKFNKADELESLIKGIEFVAANYRDECYYYDQPLNDSLCKKVIWRWSSGRCSSMDDVCINNEESGLQYPYVVVNIGSGVSVLVVRGPNDFERVSGTSIGGGFFQGICNLLCDCDTFEEAIDLASKGDHKNVDKLVSDIYGKGYDAVGLPGDTVAASFGKIVNKEQRIKAKKEDLAHAALVTTTNNIGSIGLNVAIRYDITRIVFVGNFLRVNEIAARRLASAMDFWSGGTIKALFLKHEGYFGAVGCLDKLVDTTESKVGVLVIPEKGSSNEDISELA